MAAGAAGRPKGAPRDTAAAGNGLVGGRSFTRSAQRIQNRKERSASNEQIKRTGRLMEFQIACRRIRGARVPGNSSPLPSRFKGDARPSLGANAPKPRDNMKNSNDSRRLLAPAVRHWLPALTNLHNIRRTG